MKPLHIGKFCRPSLLLLYIAGPAIAQTSGDDDDVEGLVEEIIVTGVTQDTRKFDATFSINTIDESDLQIIAAHGTAELLSTLPGFTGEGGTAGETHNNVLVRGLPQAGGYRYVPNLIDGLPMYEEPEAPFMNNDVFIKSDLMTTSVQAVKGGPGAILYSNALGAAVNYITRTGTQDFEGGYKLEVGDWGHVRNDFFISGPINDNLTYAVGGFYRVADGIRDPGYTGNSGGQLRGNVLYTSDDGTTEVKVQAHVIHDRTNFYQSIPFAVPNTRAPGTPDNPFDIDPGDVRNLGVDFGDGTPTSTQTSFYELYDSAGGQLTLDISDGINPEFNIFTVDFLKEFGDGWRLESAVRSTTGSNGFNALFNDPPFETSRLLTDQFNRIQGLGGDVGAAYAGATEVRAYFTDTVTGTDLSTASEAPSVLGNNVPVYGLVDATNFTGDFRLGKLFEVGGTSHDITVGAYTSHYTYDVFSVFARSLANISDDSRLVDLYAVDAAEQQVGPSITDNGVLEPAIFGLGADSTMRTYAFYVHDHISLLDDRLKLDVGVRWQDLEVDRNTTNSFDPGNSSNDFTPPDVVVGSTDDTLADNFVNVPDGSPRFASEEYDDVGWTIGANYLFSDNLSIYGMVSDSFRLPGFEDFIFGGPATNPSTGEVARGDQVEDITQVEGGIRFGTDELDLSVALFYIDFAAKENLGPTLDDLTATGAGGIPCTAVPAPADCPKIRDRFRRELSNQGIEVEAMYQPAWAEGLTLQGSVTWQDPEIGQDNAIRSGIEELDTDGDMVNDVRQYVVSTQEERRPRRQSEWVMNFRPSFTFGDALNVYGQLFYYSERFAEDGSANVTQYPDYTQLNVGALYALNESLDLQLHISNVNDAESFTEGGSIASGNAFADGTYIAAARPLLGRAIKFSVYYRF
ncbi:MAG: TonB-dependent receptor [Pseudomonadota bacterium]